MALIAIVLSSVLGFLFAFVHLVILDASFMQAVGTYFIVTVTLSTINITAALLARNTDQSSLNAMETHDEWAEWHESEDWRDAELEHALEEDARKSKKRAS